MERDELMKLTKEVLVNKLLEQETTDVAKAIAERDAAWTKQGEQATRITDLELENAAQAEELTKVKGELEEISAKLREMDTDQEKLELQRQVDDLNDRLAANEATKGDPRPVVKVKGKQMLFVAQRWRDASGREMTAAQAMKDPALLEALVESGSGLLKEVVLKK